MKKNKMMRAASALLVAVLLTTSVISGTFAKYITEDKGSDEARVAKWGVVIEADSFGMFKTDYTKDDTTATSGVPVIRISAKLPLVPGANTSLSSLESTEY